MKKYHIIISPKHELDINTQLLGMTLLERAAASIASLTGIKNIYAPFLEKSHIFRDIKIINKAPKSNKDIILIDPSFLFTEKLFSNLKSFSHQSAIACHAQSLEMLGFAILKKEDLFDDFYSSPWHYAQEIIDMNLNARIAVIDSPYFLISSEKDISEAQHFLLSSVRRKDDGIISRNFNRFISLFLTKIPVITVIHPNIITLTSLFVGLVGIYLLFFQRSTPVNALLFLQLSSIIAGVDGEIARVTFKKTPFGRWFNMVANDTVVYTFFLSICFATDSPELVRYSGTILLFLYPIYIVGKYIYAARFQKTTLFLNIFPFTNMKQDKDVPAIILLTIIMKRDFILFFGLILAFFNTLNIFPVLFLLLLVLCIVFSFSAFIEKLYRENIAS